MKAPNLWFGPKGIRAGWRLLIFTLVFALLSGAATWLALRFIEDTEGPWRAPILLTAEAISFVSALLAALLMARLERRSLAQYGLSIRQAFGTLFWRGALWGVLTIAAVVLLIWLLGGYSISGVALRGGDLIVYSLLWAFTFLLVGLFEELLFRGYTLFTLSHGIGFWPAALLISVLFGALHYLTKPGETSVDGLSTSLIGLFFCWTVRRTGNLWFAIGWHFTFNYGSLFLLGAPNTGSSGLPIEKHLLDSSFHGAEWLTGGAMGPEASVLIFEARVQPVDAAGVRSRRWTGSRAGRAHGASLSGLVWAAQVWRFFANWPRA
jgi:membrane protease YdiL (CAAX protease family)